MAWLAEHWGDLLVGGILLAVVVLIVVRMVRNRRAGGGCCCGCSGCPSAGACRQTERKDER